MWHEALELTVAAAVAVAHAYWPAAVVLYSLRFCFPFYRAITAYGKLRASSGYLLPAHDGRRIEALLLTRPSIVVSWFFVRARDSGLVHHRVAFTSFYVVGWLVNLIVIAWLCFGVRLSRTHERSCCSIDR